MHRYLLHNGEIHDTRERLLTPGQVGYLNGWGIFSTIRVADGVLFAFERHVARMQRDAQLLRVPLELSASDLERQLLQLVAANNAMNATLRVAVVRNKGGLFESPGLEREADVVAFTADLRSWGSGVHLSYMPHARHAASPFAGTKVTSWCQNLALYEGAHEQGFDEYILLNEEGEVSECTSANIFAIHNGKVLTPPLQTSGCLPGVTRALLLDEIRVPGLSAAEAHLTPSQLEASDQIFITSTTRDLLPVLSIDGQPMNQEPGVLAYLANAFAEYRAGYVASRAALNSAIPA